MCSTVDIDVLDAVATTLTAEENEVLRVVGKELTADLGVDELDSDRTLQAIELAARNMPQRIAKSLIDFRCNGNDYGTLLLRNLALDHEPAPTPRGGALQRWQQVPQSTLVQLLTMAWLGDVISYADEKDGALVQDIVPRPGAEQLQENSGSVFLEMHTEDGFHPHKPDHLGLLCLRSDHERVALTATASIDRALPRLSSACADLLREPLYRIRCASSFTGADEPRYSTAIPVLSGSSQRPDLCADFHAMEGLSEDASWALEQLRRAMTAVLAGAVLEPGDLVVVDNRAAVHARTAFTPRHDGNDRWLRRAFTVSDLRRSRAARIAGSRVCAPLRVIDRPHRTGVRV